MLIRITVKHKLNTQEWQDSVNDCNKEGNMDTLLAWTSKAGRDLGGTRNSGRKEDTTSPGRLVVQEMWEKKITPTWQSAEHIASRPRKKCPNL